MIFIVFVKKSTIIDKKSNLFRDCKTIIKYGIMPYSSRDCSLYGISLVQTLNLETRRFRIRVFLNFVNSSNTNVMIEAFNLS